MRPPTSCAPQAQLAALAEKAVPAGPAVAYCNTGHWAATDWFVLSEVLGRKDVEALLRLDGGVDQRRHPAAGVLAHQAGLT